MTLQPKNRPGARANHIPATDNVSPPSRSSQDSSPIPPANRFDLLVNGQITVVKNAQEGLQQSLAFLQLASSKEEKESAKIQVQSLLTRAEELILKLQVVMEIKNELEHTQKDLTQAKKAHKNTSHIRARVQWLDQRLEKLLLARRRGGLAARGRRTLPMQPPTATAHGTEFPSQATRLSRIPRSTWTRSHGPTSSTLSPYKSITDSIETTSRMDTDSQSSAIQYSDHAPSIPVQDSTVPANCSWKMDSTDSSSYPPHSNCKTDSQSSFKQSVSRGSDVWHSESEANWTMVEASSNPMKDITQSQVLSSVDDEQKQSPERLSSSQQHSLSETPHIVSPSFTLQHKETLSPFTEDEDKMPSKETMEVIASGLQRESQQHGWEDASMEESVYGFESPRPVRLFGPISWNSLCLAVNKNLVTQSEPEQRKATVGNIDLTISMLQAGMDSICREVDSLRQLVHTAARAATETGVTMPSPDKAHRHTSIYRRLPSVTVPGESVHFKQPLERNGGTSSGLVLKLPSLAAHEVPSFDAPPPSRKVYGKKADPHIYPRPSNTWHHVPVSHTEGWSTDQPEVCHSTLQDYGLRIRSSSRRRRLKSSRRSDRTISMDKDDIFNSVGHHNRRIQHLLGQLNSPVAEIRKDSIQALGALSTTEDEQVVEKLQLKLLQDCDPAVQCEAGKSLLHLGVLDSDVLQFVTTHLAEGPPELQVYLLQLLQADGILNQLRKEWKCPNYQKLCLVFCGLLSSDNPDVPSRAAILLSHIHVEEERCVPRLKAALKHSSPHYQSQALACLVQCWRHYSIDVIHCAIDQMERLHNWQLRLTAVESLIVIGEHLLSCEVKEQNIFNILLKRLVNEPVQAVRSALGRLLTKLNLNRKAETLLLARLESPNEMTRAEAITALAAFELRHQKMIQILVDCLELDPSTYVRVQVVRVLGQMKSYNMSVIRCLVEKSKGYGAVARESASALQHLSKQLNLQQEE